MYVCTYATPLSHLSEEPLGHGVGAESAMVYGEAGCEPLVHEVEVEARQVTGAQHALVHDRLAGERAGVRLGALDQPEIALFIHRYKRYYEGYSNVCMYSCTYMYICICKVVRMYVYM